MVNGEVSSAATRKVQREELDVSLSKLHLPSHTVGVSFVVRVPQWMSRECTLVFTCVLVCPKGSVLRLNSHENY